MKPFRSIFICVILLLPGSGLYAGISVTGGFDTSRKWYVKKGEQFNVIFPAGLHDFAGRIAGDADRIYRRVSDWTGYESKGPIDIVLTDNSDLANGFVRSGSRGLYITIYAVLPYQDLLDGSDAFADWYETLLVHELAHVMHFDAVDGFPSVINGIFGKLLYPNANTPRFYREGFATYAETVHGYGYGRGDYAYTDMYVRTAVSGENPPALDRSSSKSGVWPGGTGPYLYGVSFVDYLVRTGGENRLHRYNRETAGTILCKGSTAFRRVYGKPMQEAWEEWLLYEKNEAVRLQAGDYTSLHRMSSERGRVYSLAASEAGDLAAYSIRPTDSLGGLYLYDFAAGSERCIRRGLYAEDLLFSADGGRLYYIRGDLENNVYYRNNLYRYDLHTGIERRITDTGHIQGFAPLPDGDGFIVVYSNPTGTEIRLIDVDGLLKDVLTETGTGTPLPLVEQPALSPDGGYAAFSCKDDSGGRSIYTCSTKGFSSGKAVFRKVTPNGVQAYSPYWLNDTEILWTGSDGGVYNVYRTDLSSNSASRVTDVSTGVFDPAAGPGGTILVREYTPEGFCVSECTPREMGSTLQGAGSKAAFTTVSETVGPSRNRSEGEDLTAGAIEYNPLPYLLPGYWSPVFLDERIGLGVGIYTSAEDIIRRHSYKTGLGYDLLDTRVKGFIDYTLRSFPFDYSFSVFARADADAREFSPEGALYCGVSYPLLKRNYRLKADIGAVFETPYAGIDLGFIYSSTRSPGHWIGPEDGIVFQQGLYCNLTDDGFVFLSDRFTWYARIFDHFLFTLSANAKYAPGAQERVLAGRYSGYVFVPFDGVYTRGYLDVMPVRFAMNVRSSIGFSLFTVDRGPGTFPLFFERVVATVFVDNGIAFSRHGGGYPAASIGELIDDPGSHIRTSIGPQLDLDFIIGYDYPFTLQAGWAFPLSPAGSGGLFLDARFEIQI